MAGSAVLRSADVETPSWLYPAAEEVADFGAPQTAVDVCVRQMGRAVPLGIPARAAINIR